MSAPTKQPTTRTITALTARTQLGQIMQRARTKRERFVVSRNGTPTLVILSIDDYLENILPQPDSFTALQANARTRGLDRLSLADVNREVRAVRRAKRPETRSR